MDGYRRQIAHFQVYGQQDTRRDEVLMQCPELQQQNMAPRSEGAKVPLGLVMVSCASNVPTIQVMITFHLQRAFLLHMRPFNRTRGMGDLPAHTRIPQTLHSGFAGDSYASPQEDGRHVGRGPSVDEKQYNSEGG